MTTYNKIRVGTLAVAEPFMLDPHFKRAVILLCNHDNEGSFGYILNKMKDITISDLVVDFPKFNAPVFYGGPVQTDSLHFLHNVGDLLEGSKRITSGVYMGGDWDQLKFLIQQKLIEPKHIRFFMGYSGWTDTQLADECKDGSWILCDMHANYLFNSQPNTLWRTVLQNKGNAYSIIADMNDDNNIN